MNTHTEHHSDTREKAQSVYIYALIGFVLCAGLALGWWRAQTKLATANEKYTTEVGDLSTKLGEKELENKTLSEALYSEQKKNEDLEDQIDDIADTVGMLEKLSKTDPELLQKYSKVYFLNEHYSPPSFKEIEKQYRYPEVEAENIHSKVWPFLEDLMEEADNDNVDLRIISAFRSFGEQTTLKSSYSVVYGAGTANQFSADQGYSEHQLGTTVDFSTVATNGALDGFNVTPAYTWLLANAYKYGFVLSYPENNTYYQFEPWHWRFVGLDLAKDLHREKEYFYDMDQRDIDTYLVSIFDR
ncbi:MAG: M15 family metallopeptidase [Patescibacteria group bacterium]